MQKAGALFAILTIAAALAWPQTTTKRPDTDNPIHQLSWLVGGVWTADTGAMGHGMQRIETRYEWSDNGSFLRFTTHFVFDKGTARTYDGNLFWSPSEKSLAIWYMNTENEIVEGPIKIDGNLWTTTFRGTDFDGKMADLRVEVTHKSADLYHWQLSEKQADSWKDLMALDYRRASGS